MNKRTIIATLVLTGLLAWGKQGWAAEGDKPLPPSIAKTEPAARHPLGQPFWKSKKMENEPVLFVQASGKTLPTAKLLFIPTSKPKLTDPSLALTYIEGKDYVWKPGSNKIELPANSRIPFLTGAQLRPPPGSPNTLFGKLWAEGHFFHDLQVQVSYEHEVAIWNLPAAPREERLSRSLGKLRSKQPLKLVALGDSITEGYNASGFTKCEAAPYQPPYAQLVADTLQERFGSVVTCVNLGKAGTKATWGLTMVKKVAAEKPDLVILAFGMNHGEPAPAFEAVMRKLLGAITDACPQADVVLVASMTSSFGRPWAHFISYRDVLKTMQTPTVALADVTTPWLELLKVKPFVDLSGNNLNHPNDFGHRLYGHVICELFPATIADSPSSPTKSTSNK